MEVPGSVIARGAPRIVRSLQERFLGRPAHPVARALSEGDEVAGFTVLETPGHTPGHVSYWRERDRVLIVGDVLVNVNFNTSVTGLHEPPTFATPTRRATAPRRGGWPSCARRSRASATGRRCATRASWRSSSRNCRRERQHLHPRR